MSKIKNLFSSLKKGIVTSIVVMASLALIGTGTAFAMESIAESRSIGSADAESRALSDAGIDSSSAVISRTDFERENGQYVYEVEFSANSVEYEYVISADDGTIIARNIDGQTPAATPQNTPATASAAITAEQAKEIALKHASLTAADVTFVHAQLDYDDGVRVYDVEFYNGNTEYEYEIDAATGSILSFDYDLETHQSGAVHNAGSSNSGTTNIGVDSAKSIAVSHAGFSISDVTFQKAKLENDDGREEYEIEFYKDGMEYEYTIDATSGRILEYDSEYDD